MKLIDLKHISDDDCEICPDCVEARQEQDFKAILSCRRCDGTGVVRKNQSFICNQCGGTLIIDNLGVDVPHGLIDARVDGGYSSYHLMDCTAYFFSLCEKCLRNLFTGFKIPPVITDYMSGGRYNYKDDLDAYEFRLWRDAGGQRAKLETGVCNYREYCTNEAVWREFTSGHMRDVAVCDEHKFGYANSHFLRQEALKHIPANPEDRHKKDKETIVQEFIKQTCPKDEIIHFIYLPGCIKDMIGYVYTEENRDKEPSALWIPNGSVIPNWIPAEYFPPTIYWSNGMLLIGGAKLRTLAKANTIKEHSRLPNE